MNRPVVKNVCLGGVVAALYAALTWLLAPVSFGQIQFRVAEALTLLPVVSSAAVPGLFVGCLLANLLCGAPLYDVIAGSLATLLAALLTRRLRACVWLAALAPVVCNGVIVGLTLAYLYSLPPALTMATVALGELGACYLLGVPLMRFAGKRGLFEQK